MEQLLKVSYLPIVFFSYLPDSLSILEYMTYQRKNQSEDLTNRIPDFIMQCIKELISRGIPVFYSVLSIAITILHHQICLYKDSFRVSGAHQEVQELKEAANKNVSSLTDVESTHIVANMLKFYLREVCLYLYSICGRSKTEI